MRTIKIAILLLLGMFLFGCTQSNVDCDLYESYKTEKSVLVKSSQKVLIASKYLLKETIEIPSTKLTYNGKEYDASNYVIFPSGKVLNSKQVKLNEAGRYEVVYLAKCENLILSDKYEFTVTNKLFTVSGEKSSAYYGTHEYMPNTEGIITSIRPNDYFILNQPIDITSFNKNNTILTFNVLPNNIGVSDAQKIIIKLTDIYDEENYVKVELKKVEDNKLAWAENSTYVVAYSSTQEPCGLEAGSHPNTGRVVEYDGATYTIHKNNYYGAHVVYSMPGAPRYQSTALPYYEKEYVGEQEFSVAIDYAVGKVYGGPFLTLVNDLRSDIIYGTNFWQGFTTGECYLSISALNYNSESLNLIIKTIADKDAAEFKENDYSDNLAPVIDINWEDEYPVGLVNHPYPLFEATSYDEFEHRFIDVEKKVYLNYGLENQVSVQILDGKFIPLYKTTYHLVYTATDKSGNQSEVVIPIKISDDVKKITLDQIGDGQTTFNVGDVVKVKELTYKNVIGSFTEKITATLKSDSNITYEINDGLFRPLYSGEYVITYQYSDYMFASQYEYEITVNKNNTPVIIDDITLNKFYIKGCSYQLPEYYGYKFIDGKPEKVLLDIYVNENGSTRKIDNHTFIPTTEGEVTITYRIENGTEVANKDISAKVVDVGYDDVLEMGKYFYSDNVDLTAESKYIEYKLIEQKNTTLEFINELPSSNFQMRLAASELYSSFNKIHIYLTDKNDPSIRIKFTYEKQPTGFIRFYLNDKDPVDYKTLFASSENPILCEYNNSLLQVSPHPANYILVKETVYGDKFTGFTSDKINLEIEVDKIYGDSALRIVNLCGQPFTKIKADIIEPKVYINNDVGEYKLNYLYTLQQAIIADVLDPNVKSSVSVKDPDGNYVTTVDGILLDKSSLYGSSHQFELNKYGTYQVIYEAEDTNNNETVYSFVLRVVDDEKPTVTIIFPITEAKVGENINIAKIGIKDNTSQTFKIFVCVILPNGQNISLIKPNSDNEIYSSFVASLEGSYKVCYFVEDESGNTSISSYTINVK